MKVTGLLQSIRDRVSTEAVLVAAVAAAALALRLHYARYHVVMVPDYDGAEYLLRGMTFFGAGPIWTIFIPPGMPFLLSLALPFFGEPQAAGIFVSALFGAGLCVSVYLFARELFGPVTAVLAAALTAFFGQLVVASTWVMSEMPFAFFLFLGLWAGLVYQRRGGLHRAAAFGALFGAAYLIRPEAFVIFMLSAGVLAVTGKGVLQSGRRRHLVGLALAAAVFIVICLPYMVYLRGELGRWAISGKVYHNIAAGQEGLKAARETGTLSYVRDAFGELALKYRKNFSEFTGTLLAIFTAPLLALAAFGMAVSAFFGPRRPMGMLYPLVLLVFMLSLPLFFVDRRILGPYYPILLVWAAVAVSFAEAKLLSHRALITAARFRPLCVAVAAAVLIFTVSSLGAEFNSPQYQLMNSFFRARYLNTGDWLRQNSKPGEKVVSRELLLVFYSGRDYVHLPDVGPEELWRLARRENARYVVLDDNCMNKRTALGPLLAPLFSYYDISLPGFRGVYHDENVGVLIYEVEERS